jgi:3',5'-cyclic AMP phosphodiesterase CpdA
VISGDLTTDGYRREYETAREYLDRLECGELIVIPGNHDSRNVGYLHFEELFGPRARAVHRQGITIVAEDSSEPDLDHGQIGRNRYAAIAEEFARPAEFRVFVLHHHLLPVPGTGRERNIVYDAGDLLEVLLRAEVNLVLAGHKHVPYAWRLENLFMVTTGTVSTLRLRGHTRPCYNLIEIDPASVCIFRKYPFDGQDPILEFSRETQEYRRGDLFREGAGR